MSAQTRILEWSKEQKPWRQDALRRLLTAPFSKKDEDEILELLEADHKLTETKLTPQPLATSHLPNPDTAGAKLVIAALHDIKNANRLAPDQKLEFGTAGVTLIYGPNGAGKSGYARILKKACRARDVEEVLNNIYDAKSTKRLPSAALTLLLGDEAKPHVVNWEDGKPTPDELSRIAVFDNRCASVYIDQDNQLTFIPHNLDCFERLASLCDRLKERLATELRPIQAKLTTPVIALPDGTASRTFLDALAVKTDEQLQAATAWTEKDDAQLKELTALVSDPSLRAVTLRSIHAQVNAAKDVIASVAPHVTAAAVEALRQKKQVRAEARAALELAASHTFKTEPLAGTGSPPWRTLYEAARSYSEQQAYPGKAYPVLENAARCVLCQQPLERDARDRLTRFDEFVRNTVSQQLEAAQQAWNAAVAEFRTAAARITWIRNAITDALKSENQDIHAKMSAYVDAATTLCATIEASVIGDSAEPVAPVPTLELDKLDGYLAECNTDASLAEQANQGTAAVKLRQELADLSARKLLHDNTAQVEARLGDHRTVRKYERAIQACSTTGISAKGTELLKQYVTGAFELALTEERKMLGISSIPLRLNSRTTKGATSHQLKLDKTTFSGSTSAILSEGEHRAVGLASFLAEQQMMPGNAPIIVDDPVSSLDHERLHYVCRRLVNEGTKRQVIIFTHDLLFYVDAMAVAAEKGVPLKRVGVRSGPNGFGTIDPDGDPWPARALDRRKHWLEKQHTVLMKSLSANEPDTYEKEARYFYDRLRETWERLIEEGLFANVVVRFRRGVETLRLDRAILDDELYKMVHDAMTAISTYTAHDKPAAAGSTWPTPDLARQHLDALLACHAKIEQEAKAAEKRRKA